MSKQYQQIGVGMTPSKTELGRFIRDHRLELNLGQTLLAERAGMPQRSISNLEIGTLKRINDQQLERLAEALRCNPMELRQRMPSKHIIAPRTELGRLIRSRREQLGLTLDDFARKMRMTRDQAKCLEMRENPGIWYNRVKPLADALNLEVSVFAPFVGVISKQAKRRNKNRLGTLLRLRRKSLGMSICQLAKKLGVSKQCVSQIELGICNLSNSKYTLERLAEILKFEVTELQAIQPTRKLKKARTNNPLGQFLTQERLRLHLTQHEVSVRTGVPASTISGIETGKSRPRPNRLRKVADALGCEIPLELIPPPQLHEKRTSAQPYVLEQLELAFSP